MLLFGHSSLQMESPSDARVHGHIPNFTRIIAQPCYGDMLPLLQF
jgi:hypothetical protein